MRVARDARGIKHMHAALEEGDSRLLQAAATAQRARPGSAAAPESRSWVRGRRGRDAAASLRVVSASHAPDPLGCLTATDCGSATALPAVGSGS